MSLHSQKRVNCVQSSNADVMRNLFAQHVVGVFVERATKAWSPHALIQVDCVCPHIQLC